MTTDPIALPPHRHSEHGVKMWVAADLLNYGDQRAREAVRLDRASRVGAGWRCFHCDETFTDEVRAGEHFGNRPDGRPPSCIGLHEWAVACWREQVEHRSLANDYRRTLDTVWRQVLRFAGGSPDEVLGPSHDELCSRLTTNAYLALAAAPSTPPDEATSRAQFEAWARKRGYDTKRAAGKRMESQPQLDYEREDTGDAWTGWRAARTQGDAA